MSKLWLSLLIFLCPTIAQSNDKQDLRAILHLERIIRSRDHNPLKAAGVPRDGIFGTTWSSDGNKIAFYSNFGFSVEVWKSNGELDQIIHRSCESLSTCSGILAFSPDNSKLLIGPSTQKKWGELGRLEKLELNNALISIYDLAGHTLTQIPGTLPGQGQVANGASLCAVSPDGRYVAVTYYAPRSGRVDIIDTKRGWKIVKTFENTYIRGMSAGPITFSADGTKLAFALHALLRVVSTSDWSELYSIEPFRSQDRSRVPLGVAAIKFAPDSDYIAVSSLGREYKLKYQDGTSGGPINIYRSTVPSLVAIGQSLPANLWDYDKALSWTTSDSVTVTTIDGQICIWPIWSKSFCAMQNYDKSRIEELQYNKEKDLLMVSKLDTVEIFAVQTNKTNGANK